MPIEASPPPRLPGTTQLLEKTDHTLKVTNRPVTTAETLTAPYTNTPVIQSKTKLQVSSNTTATKLESSDKCTCDKGSKKCISECAHCSGKPVNVEWLNLNLLAQIDSRIEYFKKHEVLPKPQMQAAVRRALNGIPYQEAVKGASPKVNPSRHEGKRNQVVKKARLSRPTNKQSPQSKHAQSAVLTPVPNQRNPTKGDTLRCSPCLSSGGSFLARKKGKLTRQSKPTMATKTEEISHCANDKERNKDAEMMVHTEVTGSAEKQTPAVTCAAHTNNTFVTELCQRDDTFGASNQNKFSQSFNYVFVPEFKEGPVYMFSRVTQFSMPQPQTSFSAAGDSSLLEPSHTQSTTLLGKASEDVPEDLMVFSNFTATSETACAEQSPEVELDISENFPSSSAALYTQTAVRRKHLSKMEAHTNAQTEAVKEMTTQEAAPPLAPISPELTLHPEGRWHPFTTDT
ncbi:hypothetical protein P4O66_018681, partial [Electrophorus voltai]